MGFSCKQAGALLATAVGTTAANAAGMTFDFSGFGAAWTPRILRRRYTRCPRFLTLGIQKFVMRIPV
jgi:hypothetical protein